VTVKALHLYDRLGLLVPARSAAGHRIYTAADLRRVGHVVALKALGIPLRRIGAILANADAPAGVILQQQRRLLEDQRARLDRLIRVVRQAEAAAHGGSLSEILDRLIEGVTMQEGIDGMRKYYSGEAWPAARQHYEQWPSESWCQLYRDVCAALDGEAGLAASSELAQSFASRWLVLDAEDAAPAAIRLGLRRAWADRRNWPEVLRLRFEALGGERVAGFVAEVLWERWDAERVARESAGGVRARVSESRRRLYRDGRSLLGHDATSGAVKDLIARWEAIVDDETAGDAGMRAEMIRGFKARRQWPAGLVRSMAASYELDASTWSAVADLIEAGYDRSHSHAPA
jgi:DNA-binding transcriptional MerR regulator